MKAFHKVAILAITVLVGFGFQGCAKKKAASSAADAANAGANGSGGGMGTGNFDSSDLSSFTAENVLDNINLISIYFDFDQSALKDRDRSFLKVLNEALKMDKNKSVSLKIQGHCDERGSNEYNLALGERRARAVYDYLVNLGTSKKRLDVVSFGEERPADTGSTEAAWAKNRRAAFEMKR
jgi:peptidoglycan-associated lipoprotein